MNKTVRQVLGLQEHEMEGGKLRPEVVVYLTAAQVGPAGAHCGACQFFRQSTSECFLTDPPACNAEHGVSALFLKGESIFKEGGTPLKKVAKDQAGYTEDGPTKCATCEYFNGKDACEKVGGTIEANGCCNYW